MFDDNAEISYVAAEHPKAQDWFLGPDRIQYDVIVLYDMYQPISDEAKAGFVTRLKEGKGLVVLHHAIANYQDWPEYRKIIGARYYLQKTIVDGVEKARSAYKHDVDFEVQIANPEHPVTAGLKSFQIHDETYKWFDVAPGVTTLLTTDEPESNKVIAWAKSYEAARVVYIQLGHDHFAYENPSYRQMVRQAIRWTTQKGE